MSHKRPDAFPSTHNGKNEILSFDLELFAVEIYGIIDYNFCLKKRK